MEEPTQTIAVDGETAALIERKADEVGLTPAEFVAALVRAEDAAVDSCVAELERRWAEAQTAGGSVSHERVRRWLGTWGSARFEPWSETA